MLKQAFLTILVLLACSVALMEGFHFSSHEHCLCRSQATSRSISNLSNVAKIEYFMPSGSCHKEELMVYFKDGQSRCLNLTEEKSRRIKWAIMSKKK